MLKYSEAKKILAKYVGIGGVCPDNDEVDLFVRQVLQYLLLNGTYGNERKFRFHAENGTVTLPRELETPLKMKIDGAIGSVWNRWFEYHSGNQLDNCCLAQDSLFTEPNSFPTVYDLPPCGAFPGVIGVCEESADAHVIVKGEDPTGRVIYTQHQGVKIVGVYLSIKKGVITVSDVKFGRITEVVKTPTNGYVTLLGLDESGLSRKFLADYDPFEETPSYRRARIIKQPCPDICQVTILGRIRLKDHYADEDVIPFDNIYLLTVAGQTVNSMYNTDIASATARDTYVKGLIESENNFRRVSNGQPMEVFRPLSGGAVMNAARAGRNLRRYGYNRIFNGR